MSDDRPLEDAAAAIHRLTSDLADLQSTVMARLARRPTGDVEPTIRSTPKGNTLFLDGALVSRTTYPALWQWVQDHGLVIAGLFTVGDGSTTFGLPDMRGRVPIGVGALGADTYALGATGGAASRTLTTAQMPSHTHPLTGGTGTAAGNGDHAGHFDGTQVTVAAGGDYGVAAWNSVGSTRGFHDHSVAVSVFATAVGGGGAFDNRPAYLALNWAIWT